MSQTKCQDSRHGVSWDANGNPQRCYRCERTEQLGAGAIRALRAIVENTDKGFTVTTWTGADGICKAGTVANLQTAREILQSIDDLELDGAK